MLKAAGCIHPSSNTGVSVSVVHFGASAVVGINSIDTAMISPTIKGSVVIGYEAIYRLCIFYQGYNGFLFRNIE